MAADGPIVSEAPPAAAGRPAVAAALTATELAALPRGQLEAMRAAGAEILECYRVLRKGGLNIVGEVLRGEGTFYELNHYPEDDVYDPDSHAQYYYHAHRGFPGEHGHFHTFLRTPGMPPGAVALNLPKASGDEGNDETAHLMAISMDAYGFPMGLFVPNRWVAGDRWYRGEDLMRALDRFRIDHAYPSWPVNRWITAMFVLFRPHMMRLLTERDRVLQDLRQAGDHPGELLERRDIDVLAWMPVSVDQTIAAVNEALMN